MRFNEYQRDAILTANTELKEGERLANWCMGLAGETGELVDLMKRQYITVTTMFVKP